MPFAYDGKLPWRPKHHRRHLPCPNQPLVHCNNMASNVRRSKRSRLSPPLPQSHEELQIICAGCSLDLCNSAYAPPQCGHIMCFECFGAAQANRSADLRIKCPHRAPNDDCTCETDTWDIHTPAITRTRRDSSDGRNQRHYLLWNGSWRS